LEHAEQNLNSLLISPEVTVPKLAEPTHLSHVPNVHTGIMAAVEVRWKVEERVVRANFHADFGSKHAVIGAPTTIATYHRTDTFMKDLVQYIKIAIHAVSGIRMSSVACASASCAQRIPLSITSGR
jgi:hypothetical protein